MKIAVNVVRSQLQRIVSESKLKTLLPVHWYQCFFFFQILFSEELAREFFSIFMENYYLQRSELT